MPQSVFLINRSDLKRDPAEEGALVDGKLALHPAEFWKQFSQREICYFCVRYGIYCVPTVELVEWLRMRIGERSAIEIGAGNGVISAALKIPATDSRMQEDPAIALYYASIKQGVVQYGDNVRRVSANEAVRTFKPEVVIAAWVTHKFRPHETWRSGSEVGVVEEEIVDQAEYVFIGNSHAHDQKPILQIPHAMLQFPWLISRAIEGENYICVWTKKET